MIVSCPSCSTRYRHEVRGPVAAVGECSRCDEQFPLREARRSYVLVPPRARGAAAPAPMLAPVPRVVAPVPPIAAPPPPPVERPVAASLLPALPNLSGPRITAPDPADMAARIGEEFDVRPPEPAPPRSALAEFLVAIVPPTVAATVAYFVALRGGQDPVAWSALGGAAGFLLGWGCLLWIRRKR